MPKVEYTKAKGLVQSTGSGFALNSIETMNGSDLTLTRGTTVAILKSAHDVTLPVAATAGDMIIIVADNASAEIAAAGTQIGGKVTFNSVGDGALAVYDGTEWQVLRSIV